ncbi:MAG: TonB-dependent receptor, partial [Sphingopyxis sp.]|nr:TonB-dependent receptor [Sphingopyxis sp.]
LLRPEESRGWDVGFVLRNSERPVGGLPVGIRVEASLFRRDSRDLIDFVSCTSIPAPAICGSGTRRFGTYANVDRARAEGGEIDVTLWPAPGWSVNAGYAYIATRDRSIGQPTRDNRLARRPVHSGSAGIDYQSRAFGMGATVQLVGDSFDDAGNRVRIDGYALAMLRGHVVLSERIELFGRIENLFDARYETVAGYGTYGRTASIGVRARL